uniref:Uncharacterized protein n=1 Tax=Siphoviridae sp. ctrCN24 TaxID=2827953 RepID=A0A8S5SKV1_9CAUD|nr:MAG TPA: hypothetical protein [Siphoviridae sp. ctrCN24]
MNFCQASHLTLFIIAWSILFVKSFLKIFYIFLSAESIGRVNANACACYSTSKQCRNAFINFIHINIARIINLHIGICNRIHRNLLICDAFNPCKNGLNMHVAWAYNCAVVLDRLLNNIV